MRSCERCRRTFQQAFGMPDLWWADHCKNSNGYFGCDTKRDADGQLSIGKPSIVMGPRADSDDCADTWAYFEMKLVDGEAQYEWMKVNIFTHWVASSNQLAVLLFDAPQTMVPSMAASFSTLDMKHRQDPFWPYTSLMGEITRHEDAAVMGIRNHVRAVEKEHVPNKEKPEPSYRWLHDISRHAVHVTETLDVSIETMDGMLLQHEAIKERLEGDDSWQTVHRQLCFSRQLLKGLRWRSMANEKRLQNEIQLAFHMVTQYDSGVSVAIGKAAKEDSAAMKTIATLTLIFLPPTFISSVFSMSFFKFDTDTGWTMSNNFWIYWVWAIPMTLITSALWYYWQKQTTPEQSQVAEDGRRKRRSLSSILNV
ncbi:hypothetical protein PG999_011714 [Apiospora kogelbergensis]|uniref:CorA-like Mg2+ transporter protein n=1 Tax=Apiospora kogelbergensis TaxID=1337665 RepID=A0AAW0QDP9_9PEZI